MRTLRITTVVENTVRARDLIAEHGLSFLVESEGATILFDTGQGRAFPENAAHLGIKLNEIDAMVLSHGHYDHTGSVEYVLGEAKQATVFLHPNALEAKYTRHGSSPARRIGMPESAELTIRSRPNKTVWAPEPVEVAPGVFATGQIPRHTSYEDTGGAFFLDEACSRPDLLVDDQALYIKSPRGMVVLLGCAHSGVVNTLDYVAKLSGCSEIHAVIGGTHLLRASAERLEATAQALTDYRVEVIAPCHCTGAAATAFLRTRFPSRVVECSTGIQPGI